MSFFDDVRDMSLSRDEAGAFRFPMAASIAAQGVARNIQTFAGRFAPVLRQQAQDFSALRAQVEEWQQLPGAPAAMALAELRRLVAAELRAMRAEIDQVLNVLGD